MFKKLVVSIPTWLLLVACGTTETVNPYVLTRIAEANQKEEETPTPNTPDTVTPSPTVIPTLTQTPSPTPTLIPTPIPWSDVTDPEELETLRRVVEEAGLMQECILTPDPDPTRPEFCPKAGATWGELVTGAALWCAKGEEIPEPIGWFLDLLPTQNDTQEVRDQKHELARYYEELLRRGFLISEIAFPGNLRRAGPERALDQGYAEVEKFNNRLLTICPQDS